MSAGSCAAPTLGALGAAANAGGAVSVSATNAGSGAARDKAASNGAAERGREGVAAAGAAAGAVAERTADACGKGSNLVLGYLVAYLRTKWLSTWKNPRPGKRPAPVGTMANPFGTVTVDKSRSLWCPRVRMTGIKPAFKVPALSPRRFRLTNVDDVVVVTAITVFTNKAIAEVISALLVLCTLEPELPRIIDETLAASFEARPPRHQSLVLSGLDLQQPPGEGGDAAGGVSGGGGPAVGAVAAGVAPSANDGNGAGGRISLGGLASAAEAPDSTGACHVSGPGGGAPEHGAPVVGGAQDGGGSTVRGGGAPGEGDGTHEGVNTSVEATYIMRAMLAAASKRASRLVVRRAARAKEANARVVGAPAVLAGPTPPANGTPSAATRAEPSSRRPPTGATGSRTPSRTRKRRALTGSGSSQAASKSARTGAARASTASVAATRGEPAVGGQSPPTLHPPATAGPSASTRPSTSARPSGREGAAEGAGADESSNIAGSD